MKSPWPVTDCSDRLKVLADPTRFAVLEILVAGPRHVGQISALLHLEQSLLSHHLRVLRQARFVVAQRDGKAVLYRLAPELQCSPASSGLNLGCCVLQFNLQSSLAPLRNETLV